MNEPSGPRYSSPAGLVAGTCWRPRRKASARPKSSSEHPGPVRSARHLFQAAGQRMRMRASTRYMTKRNRGSSTEAHRRGQRLRPEGRARRPETGAERQGLSLSFAQRSARRINLATMPDQAARRMSFNFLPLTAARQMYDPPTPLKWSFAAP